jgi:hypothetical protein
MALYIISRDIIDKAFHSLQWISSTCACLWYLFLTWRMHLMFSDLSCHLWSKFKLASSSCTAAIHAQPGISCRAIDAHGDFGGCR